MVGWETEFYLRGNCVGISNCRTMSLWVVMKCVVLEKRWDRSFWRSRLAPAADPRQAAPTSLAWTPLGSRGDSAPFFLCGSFLGGQQTRLRSGIIFTSYMQRRFVSLADSDVHSGLGKDGQSYGFHYDNSCGVSPFFDSFTFPFCEMIFSPPTH